MDPFVVLINYINFWIQTNGNREITAAVLNPVLKNIAIFADGVMGKLENLNTTDRSNLVAAINEVNTNLGNININASQVLYGLADPNVTPPPSYNAGDFYLQEDVNNNPIFLFLYDGFLWQNITVGKTPRNIYNNYNGTPVTVPANFTLNRIVNLNDGAQYSGVVVGTSLTITSGVAGDNYLIDGYTS